VPGYIREIVESIAFQAREDKKVDKRSGVSQRLPISVLENVISNAERRAILNREKKIVPRVCDVYAALHSMTGKIELEYEGELKGADKVAQELIRNAVGQVFSRYFNVSECQQIINWFDLGGSLKLSDATPAEASFKQLRVIQGLVEKTGTLGIKKKEDLPSLVSACEFILDGLHALQKINRSEEKGYYASEKKRAEAFFDDQRGRTRKTYN